MAIIHTYPRKPVPKKEDLIIISDSDSSNPVNATRSATLESLSDIGLEVVIGNVEYINANKVQLTFSAAFSGKAYFN